jgi:hypothetical protein
MLTQFMRDMPHFVRISRFRAAFVAAKPAGREPSSNVRAP